jgi:hypothetical protein
MVDRCVQFAVGDLWVALEDAGYGKRTELAADGEFGGYAITTLQNYGSIARAIPHAVRTSPRGEVLSFSHFRVVAKLTGNPKAQGAWLDKAIAEQWSVTDLDHAVWEANRQAEIRAWSTGDAPDPARRGKPAKAPTDNRQAYDGDEADDDEEWRRTFNRVVGELARCEGQGSRMFATTNATPSSLRRLAAFIEVVADEIEGRTIEHEPSAAA